MREDPVFSGGFVKAALVVLFAGALGVGAYALAGGGIDVDLPDLPDLPEIDTVEEGESVNLEDTTLEDTTIDAAPVEEPADLFTSASFAEALAQIRAEAGNDAELTRLLINGVQTQAIVRRGEQVEAFSVRADDGELVREEATITISGNASLADFAFELAAIDPAAVDRMLAAAAEQSGAADFEPTVLSLERAIPSGRRDLEWTINARGGGRNLLYEATADGGKVRSAGGAGTPIPPAAIEAQKLNECIQAAGNDPEQIFACLDRFQ